MAREEEEKLAGGGCFCRDAVVAARERLSDERMGREKRWNFEENSLAGVEEGQRGVYIRREENMAHRFWRTSIDKL